MARESVRARYFIGKTPVEIALPLRVVLNGRFERAVASL